MKQKSVIVQIFLIGCLILCGDLSAQGGKQYVKVKKENLRKSPNGEKIGELVSGSQVEILEKQSNWTKVQVSAWIWSGSLAADSTQVEGFQIRVSHMLFKTQADAQKAMDRLSKGDAFESVARELSIDRITANKGGDLGLFGRGDLMPEFETVAFALKVNEISKPVKTDLGYHIIMRKK